MQNCSKEGYSLCVAPTSPVNHESVTKGDFTPSVLHRQDSESVGHANARPYRLGRGGRTQGAG